MIRCILKASSFNYSSLITSSMESLFVDVLTWFDKNSDLNHVSLSYWPAELKNKTHRFINYVVFETPEQFNFFKLIFDEQIFIRIQYDYDV